MATSHFQELSVHSLLFYTVEVRRFCGNGISHYHGENEGENNEELVV